MKKLRVLLRDAYDHVPLWNALLSERGLTPSDIRSLEDITKLPVTSKLLFRGKMVEEYINNSRPIRSHWYLTSGTSGTPLRFFLSENAITEQYIDFASFRFLWWKGQSLARTATTKLARIKIRGPRTEFRLFVSVEEFLTTPREALAKIVDFKTEILSAYPSILLEMVRLVRSDPTLPRPQVAYVLSFGEMLAPSVRRLIEEEFTCEVFDRYGLEEIGVIGLECAQHDGFHVNTESVIIEILDETSTPVAEGVLGSIIATDLFNFGMPFIRYDTGDRGRISYARCPCGLRSPRLWIEGRYSSYLSFATRRIHHLEFDGAMDGFMNDVYQYQIVKVGESSLVVRIVPSPSFSEVARMHVHERIRGLVGSTIAVRVECVETISLIERGKSRIISDESVPIP